MKLRNDYFIIACLITNLAVLSQNNENDKPISFGNSSCLHHNSIQSIHLSSPNNKLLSEQDSINNLNDSVKVSNFGIISTATKGRVQDIT